MHVKATDKIGSSNNSRQWLAHVEAQQKSGLSRTEYCKQYNLSYHAMTYWTRKAHSPSGNKTTLVPVPFKSVPLPHLSGCAHPTLRINLSGKISITIGDDFSSNTLVRLLDTLEAR
jgi:hypothetical protein